METKDLTIKQIRVMKNLTQDDLANLCGVHRNTIASWETSPEKISVGNAKLIAQALDVDVNAIIFAPNYNKML